MGAGLMVLDNTSKYTRQDANVVDEAVIITNTSLTCLANDYITTSSATFENRTGVITDFTANITWDSTGKYAGYCVMYKGVPTNNLRNITANVTYTYGKSTTASTSISAYGTAIETIGSNWFSLVVTIVVLSLILTLVITSFGQFRQR